MSSDIHSVLVGETWRKAGMVAKATGSAITSGTVNYYLKALTGDNAGKWWKNADQTWDVSETANAMTHQADGSWTITLAATPFTAAVVYLEYAKESGDLHVAGEGRLLRGQAVVDAANLTMINGTSIAGTSTQVAVAFVKMFNVASPTGTVNSLPDAVAGAAGGVAIVGSAMGITAGAIVTATFGTCVLPETTKTALLPAVAAGAKSGLPILDAATGLILTGYGAGGVTVDVRAISGDSTAADNLETAFDGTGYSFDTQQQARAALRVSGTVWFVGSAGNNSWDGLSPKTAHLTPGKIQTGAAGDMVMIGPGSFTAAEVAVAAGIVVQGAGMGVTRIDATSMNAWTCGNYAVLRDLTISNLEEFQEYLGTLVTEDITGVVMERVHIIGNQDGLRGGGTFYDCECTGRWDPCIITNPTRMYNCKCVADGRSSAANAQARALQIQLSPTLANNQSRTEFHDGYYEAKNPATGGYAHAVHVWNAAGDYPSVPVTFINPTMKASDVGNNAVATLYLEGDADVTVLGGALESHNSDGTALDIHNAGTGTLRLIGVKYDRSKVSNTGGGQIIDVDSLEEAYDAAKTAAQAGDSMALTSDERIAIAAAIEADLIDDETHQAVMAAIVAKLEAGFPDLDTLTLAAIATQVRTELETELAYLDATVSSRGTSTLTTSDIDARLTAFPVQKSGVAVTLPTTAPDGYGGSMSDEQIEELGDSVGTAVWVADNRTLTGASGAVVPNALDANADGFLTIPKNGTDRMVKRVYLDGVPITQAAITSIAYSIFLLDEDEPDTRTAVTGHSGVSLTVANVIFDTLQTDSQYGNYNFRHTPPIGTYNAFATAGANYLVEYTITPTSGEKIITRFKVNVI